MGLYLKLEGAAGTTIEEAAEQMVNVANQLGIGTQMNFNDTTIMVWPGDASSDVIRHYRVAVRRGIMICGASFPLDGGLVENADHA